MKPGEWLGKQIREYRLTDIMGSGGMSAVFRAMHVRLQIERAVKVLRPNLARDPEFVERFEQEARILAVLEHPNLIRVYEFFEEQGFLFIVMELVSGDSLEDLVLYHGVIPAWEMSEILSQAAQGLDYAHNRGIVHRDLSPDNIMVAGYDDRSIKAKVIDFGIARRVTVNSISNDQVIPEAFAGKFRYCSPEQAWGKPVDHRSDQYTLALIFLESVTGKPVFQEETTTVALLRRMQEPPPKLADIIPGTAWPSGLDRVIARAMHIEPEKRYSSILEFVESLAIALERVDILESPAEALISETHWIQSNDKNDDADPDENVEAKHNYKKNVSGELTHEIGEIKSVKQAPRYGRVAPPTSSQKLPWKTIIFLSLIVTVFVSYFVIPEKDRLSIKNKIERFLTAGYNRVIDTFVQEENQIPVATPYRLPKVGTVKEQKDGLYWYKKPGVTAPVMPVTGPFDLPRHLREKYDAPVSILLQCSVLKNGKPGRCIILKGVDENLDDLAIKMVESWIFQPGMVDGEPVDVYMDMTITFK